MLMDHDEDPKEKIFEAVGDLSDIEVFGNWVLLGVYERPEKTKSGLYLSDVTRKEDEHQGKCGLVLKKGPSAFVSDDNYNFRGLSVEAGDWCAMFVTDGRKIKIKGQLCRMVEDMHIRMRVSSPDVVY
jgi:co-chaperonin GroES (HSP10)